MNRNIHLVFAMGTRPEIVKLAPIMRIINKEFILLWSGQHYDYELSKIFFEELGGLMPDFDLGVGSCSHGVQVAKIIGGIESTLKNIGDKGIVVAVGDTNTVLGAGLAAVKAGWMFTHVESGLRSYDRYMPEEINRVIADHIANVLFAPSVQATLNLLYEGIEPWRIWLTGNTIVDSVKMVMPLIKRERNRILSDLDVKDPYALVTLHRAENVDYVDRLSNILKGLKEVSKDIQLVFPIHPRTLRRIKDFGLSKLLKGFKIIKPLGYIEFLALLSNAEIVLTDSGGVQEEAFTLGVPCITLRRNTERPETVWLGGNILVGDDPRIIVKSYKYIIENREEIVKKIKSSENPYGDGRASRRIASILENLVEDYELFMRFSYSKENEPDYRKSDYPTFIIINGSAFRGMKIEEIHQRYRDIYITLIYDNRGRPLIPYNDTTIKETWKLRIQGPKKTLEKIRYLVR